MKANQKARENAPNNPMRIPAILAVILAPLVGILNAFATPFRSADAAQLNLTSALGVVGVIIGAVVTFIVIASLFPTFADSVADVNENLTNDSVTFGDTTTDNLKPTFAIVVGLAALLGIVGIALGVFSGRLGGP